MISRVGKVVMPVDDQQRANDFWVDRLGFELRRDESYGDERWIEVSPPGHDLLLALSTELTRAHRARRRLPGAARAPALRLVGAVRRSGRHPLRARAVGVSATVLSRPCL